MARLDRARTRFESRILEAEEIVRRSLNARDATSGRPAYTVAQLEWIYEASLLKAVVSSEQFLEETLGLYAIGEKTKSGYRPRRRRMLQSSLPEILKVFRGDQEYIGWTSPAVIIARAEQWLTRGGPYQSTLSAASQLLNYVKVMRNVIAHESDSASEKYAKVTLRLYGANPKRSSPGAQLMRPPPAAIPGLIGATLFEATNGLYRSVAAGIVR